MSGNACTRCVFRSFKKVERFADRVTGRAGPVFVSVAVVLIGASVVTFFDVVFPAEFLAPERSWAWTVAGSIWCAYVVCMFSFHYYKACTVRPGSPTDPPRAHLPPPTTTPLASLLACLPFTKRSTSSSNAERERRRMRAVREIQAQQAHEALRRDSPSPTSAAARAEGAQGEREEREREIRAKGRVCKKCPEGANGKPAKPERAHHCSVCKKCILKFDHHCPWINQCVGLHNERYFLLFLLYFSLGCLCVSVWGWTPVWESLQIRQPWPHTTPRTFTLLLWILALVMGLAVGVMGLYQVYLVSRAESAVESHDNEYYRRTAKSAGRVWRNPYDLGRTENLREFFNVAEGGYHWSTIFLPVEVPPSCDGWRWRKAEGWQSFWMTNDEELTDEEWIEDD